MSITYGWEVEDHEEDGVVYVVKSYDSNDFGVERQVETELASAPTLGEAMQIVDDLYSQHELRYAVS